MVAENKRPAYKETCEPSMGTYGWVSRSCNEGGCSPCDGTWGVCGTHGVGAYPAGSVGRGVRMGNAGISRLQLSIRHEGKVEGQEGVELFEGSSEGCHAHM